MSLNVRKCRLFFCDEKATERGRREMEKSSAARAGAEELELVVEVFEARFLADFLFEFVDGAGSLDGGNRSAVGADQVIAMLARHEEGEVSGALVEAEAAHESFVGEFLEEAENRGLVAEVTQARGIGQLAESHRAVLLAQGVDELGEGTGAAQAGVLGSEKDGFGIRHGRTRSSNKKEDL